MRFVHTADWQIGKPFARFGEKSEGLRKARLDAIETLGRLARDEDAPHILVAGDIFDSESPSPVTLRAPLERMRQFPDTHWHLLPGNHDPNRSGGIWDRFTALGLPANVTVHGAAVPIALDEHTWLLPAPLMTKTESRDITAFMDGAATPEGAVRIGLAHGSIANFAGADGEATNPIAADRAAQAGLAYLALGDWHRTQQINTHTWYAGTPEPDRHNEQNIGRALVISVDASRAEPKVWDAVTGTYRWHNQSMALSDAHQLADLEATLARDAAPLSRLVLQLAVSGAVSLETRKALDACFERLQASVYALDCDISALHVTPVDADLEAIDFDGVLRKAADRLKLRIADQSLPETDRRVAEDALVALYLEGTASA
jgi:DNA repair exonuclease SbcCD nuclease subunit